MSFPHAAKHGIFALPAAVLFFLILLLAPPYTAAQTNSNPYGHVRVTPSVVVVVVVVLVSVIFFVGFLTIYIRHCNDSSGSLRRLGATSFGISRRGAAARGLDAAVIETFPTMAYAAVKGLKIGKGALECAVCLNEFEDHETLRLLPKCDHAFHPECIDSWLSSHTTCPVCRADLAAQPTADPPPGQLSEPAAESDPEAQNDAVETEPKNADQTLNKNLTRGSGSGRRALRKFPRSHSTGHSLVQPGENTDRFTLRLPAEVRKQIMNRELNRTLSLVVLPGEGSSRRGYRTGEGSSRGKHFGFKRIEGSDQNTKSGRRIFSITPPFLSRASSFLTRASSSVTSPKVAASGSEGTSTQLVEPKLVDSTRPPV